MGVAVTSNKVTGEIQLVLDGDPSQLASSIFYCSDISSSCDYTVYCNISGMRPPPMPPGMMPMRPPPMPPMLRPPPGFMPVRPPPSVPGQEPQPLTSQPMPPAVSIAMHYPSQDPTRMGAKS